MPISKEEIKEYLSKDIFEGLNLDDIPMESRLALLAKLADVVYLRFINKLSEIIDDESIEKLEEIVKQGDVDGFQKFLDEKVPNYNEILSEIIAEEKKMLLDTRNLVK
ncbi:MAG: hypothetical protein N2692_00450 [Patescibacteria group bacterium]|nr:hypothetical protein [Patescibacteria group bacterium]